MVNWINRSVRNEQVSVTTSSAVICSPRFGTTPRKVLVIRNTSPNATDIITINLGGASATANKGIVLKQYESFSDSSETGYQCHQDFISAICETADGKLSIMEK
jgi:hypothetical protein